MARTRTFVAVDLSPGVRQRAADLIERLKSSDVRVSWVVPKNMHISLKFLGEQTDDEVSLICRAVLEAVKDLQSFEFCCFGAGAFPHAKRPRTLWIGVREGAESLRHLQQCVDERLADLGYAKERRAYQPHLTIGRVRSGGPSLEKLGQLVQKAQEFQAGSVQADQVLVFGSFLQRNSGPRYEVLARAPLAGDA